MNFESVKEKFLKGVLVKRKGSTFIYKYQGVKKNRKTDQEFYSVILVDENEKFKGYAKIGFNDVLAEDWEVLEETETPNEELKEETEALADDIFGGLQY